MRRFKFRLETILEHRETIENLREQDFAVAQHQWQAAQGRYAQLQDEFARTVSERPGRAGEHFDAGVIFDRERYLETLQAAIEQQARRVQAAAIVADEKRRDLLAARQAREAVSQLKEKDLEAHTLLSHKLEQETLDELATLRYVRAINASERHAA